VRSLQILVALGGALFARSYAARRGLRSFPTRRSSDLVVVYALAGTMDIDFATEPIATTPDGKDVFLPDVWPTQAEIDEVVAGARSEEHTSELQSRENLVCRLLLEKKKRRVSGPAQASG